MPFSADSPQVQSIYTRPKRRKTCLMYLCQQRKSDLWGLFSKPEDHKQRIAGPQSHRLIMFLVFEELFKRILGKLSLVDVHLLEIIFLQWKRRFPVFSASFFYPAGMSNIPGTWQQEEPTLWCQWCENGPLDLSFGKRVFISMSWLVCGLLCPLSTVISAALKWSPVLWIVTSSLPSRGHLLYSAS